MFLVFRLLLSRILGAVAEETSCFKTQKRIFNNSLPAAACAYIVKCMVWNITNQKKKTRKIVIRKLEIIQFLSFSLARFFPICGEKEIFNPSDLVWIYSLTVFKLVGALVLLFYPFFILFSFNIYLLKKKNFIVKKFFVEIKKEKKKSSLKN